MELFIKIGVDDQASQKVSDISTKLGTGLKNAAKIGAAAVGAGAAAVTAFTTKSIKKVEKFFYKLPYQCPSLWFV